MSNKGKGWTNTRTGQRGVASVVSAIVEGPREHETVQQIASTLIDDSPYQARAAFDERAVADLAEGMRSTGFVGSVVGRRHPDPAKREQGYVQLAYGHRRRAAWAAVCKERGEECIIPIVVREISDIDMLTIGAQENLQREDLSILEEAQLVTWHEQAMYPAGAAEIGQRLGKTAKWVELRARVAKLPEPLKALLAQRLDAGAHMVELITLYREDPDSALGLAQRVVSENLSLAALRQELRALRDPAAHPSSSASAAPLNREERNDLPVNRELVPGVTSTRGQSPAAAPEDIADLDADVDLVDAEGDAEDQEHSDTQGAPQRPRPEPRSPAERGGGREERPAVSRARQARKDEIDRARAAILDHLTTLNLYAAEPDLDAESHKQLLHVSGEILEALEGLNQALLRWNEGGG